MNKDLRIFIAAVINFGLLFTAQCQSDPFAFAVTDVKMEGGAWIMLRKFDTRTGEFSNVLVDGTNQKSMLYDSYTGGKYESSIKDTSNLIQPQLPFGTGVAAIAFDRKNNRLFFAPMYLDQLRYVDLNSMKIFCVTDKGFNNTVSSTTDPGNTMSRMVIAGDGNGYCISNDGNHLYRFTTTGTPVISDLGSLRDSPGNNEMTIHNSCGNAGGDMIADDDGNLYLISAQNRIYKVSIRDLEAKYIGKISGLPEKFSANGAAVDAEGQILISSSIYGDAYFKVDPLTWKGTEYKPKKGIYKSADLANSNILSIKNSSSKNAFSVINIGNKSLIKLYPNPVENNLFVVKFTNLEAGEYALELSDMLGRTLIQKKILINSGTHTETVRIPPKSSIGFYIVKIVNEKNKQVFREKIMVKQLQ